MIRTMRRIPAFPRFRKRPGNSSRSTFRGGARATNWARQTAASCLVVFALLSVGDAAEVPRQAERDTPAMVRRQVLLPGFHAIDH